MKGDWYFDGYEGRRTLGRDGKSRKELVYTGEYYGFVKGKNPVPIKVACILVLLVYLVCYFLNALSISATSKVIYIGFPMMISMVPGLYLLMGTVCLLPAKAEMTVRVCNSSIVRINRSLMFMLPLLAISFGGSLILFIRTPSLVASQGDLLYALLVCLAFASILFEWILLRKNPVIVVRDPQPESARVKELAEKKRKAEDRQLRFKKHFKK